jgi:hypothetical protein
MREGMCWGMGSILTEMSIPQVFIAHISPFNEKTSRQVPEREAINIRTIPYF